MSPARISSAKISSLIDTTSPLYKDLIFSRTVFILGLVCLKIKILKKINQNWTGWQIFRGY